MGDCVEIMKGWKMDFLIARARTRKRKNEALRKTKTSSCKIQKRKPPITERQMLKAIENSLGNKSVIASKLDRPYKSVLNYLNKKATDNVREAMRVEEEKMVDIAEQTNVEMMTQRIHFPTAIRASHFVLTKHPKGQNRGWKDNTTTTIQGGKPIEIEHKHILSIEKLKTIDIDTRRKMLEEMSVDIENEK